ncbi:MAG: signal peptidase I [Candidatus Niyogibacteria bacterium]|nr:signal peptidase I [Candidatus Niyogibacteria bacterium]
MSIFSKLNKSEIWEFLKLIIVSLLIIVPIRLYIAQPFIVKGSSMDPSFYNGDYLIVDELSYHFNKPKRGEVVIFRYPLDASKFFIKRVIGLPGETISIEGDTVTIFNSEHPDGFVLREDYMRGAIFSNAKVILDAQEYYVMGDNRSASFDSRYWGALAEDKIIGRAVARLWPIASMGLWPGIK